MPPDAPLRRIGRVLLVVFLVYAVPPLGAWWARTRTAWPKRRKVIVAVVAAVWLPLWMWAMWLAAEADSESKQGSAATTTTPPATTEGTTKQQPSETLGEWWSTSWPLFDRMNEDLYSIEEAGQAEDRTALADACNALWGSLTSIQLNPPPV